MTTQKMTTQKMTFTHPTFGLCQITEVTTNTITVITQGGEKHKLMKDLVQRRCDIDLPEGVGRGCKWDSTKDFLNKTEKYKPTSSGYYARHRFCKGENV